MTRILGIILGIVLMSGSVPVMSFAETVNPFANSEIILSSDTSTNTESRPISLSPADLEALDNSREAKKEQLEKLLKEQGDPIPQTPEEKIRIKFEGGFFDKIQNEKQQNNLFHQCLGDAKLEQGFNIITSSNTSADSVFRSDVISDKDLESVNLSPQCITMLAGKSVSSLVQDYGYHDIIILVPKIAENGLDAKTVANNNKDSLESVLKSIGVTQYYKAERLSFVTAQVSVEKIEKLADHKFVSGIGDGELKIVPDLDFSRVAANAQGPFTYGSTTINGNGIKVAVMEPDYIMNNPSHQDLPLGSKIIQTIFCSTSSCITFSPNTDSEHKTRVAGIIAGSGSIDPTLRGIATGAQILDVNLGGSSTDFLDYARALDWSLQNGVQVVNSSFHISNNPSDDGLCTDLYQISNVVVDEAIDEGLVVVHSAGNAGNAFGDKSITNPGCGFNVITVGAFDDKNTISTNDDVTYSNGGRGPVASPPSFPSLEKRLKPEIIAPGVSIKGPNNAGGYTADSGTSFAAPHVTATAALLLQQNPFYNPLEVKSALILGAKWNSTLTPMTASTYESLPTSTTLNMHGFGSLNAGNSLAFAQLGNYMIYDSFGQADDGPPTVKKYYSFTATSGQEVKIFLSWFAHPSGAIIDPPTAQTISDLDLRVLNPTGQLIYSSVTGKTQNTEFIVFNTSTLSGTFTIEVEAFSISPFTTREHFVLASTKPLIASCPSPPVAGSTWLISRTCIIASGTTTIPSNSDVMITNDSDLIVMPGATLNISFSDSFLKVVQDGRVIVKNTGKIM
jgi:subtilisin family serine protease